MVTVKVGGAKVTDQLLCSACPLGSRKERLRVPPEVKLWPVIVIW